FRAVVLRRVVDQRMPRLRGRTRTHAARGGCEPGDHPRGVEVRGDRFRCGTSGRCLRDAGYRRLTRVVTAPAWGEHPIWWQVYPLGFVGAYPTSCEPPRPGEHRLRRLVDWFDHAIALGASGIALGPIFASRTHGYDTTDHYRIDPRLGDEADFDYLVAEAHRRGLRVLLDGVFNHVGVDFAR